MTRDELVDAVLELPADIQISIANVGPNDVIVVQTHQQFTQTTSARIASVLERVWVGRKVLVIDGGMEFKIVRESQGKDGVE